MKGLNKVLLIGNLGHDPETRTTAGGLTVANLNVATNERQKKGGEWVEHTEWHRVIVFGKTAEAVDKVLRKGAGVYIEGRIQTRQWEDKQGNKRYTTEIVANDIVFLDDKPKGNGNQNRPSQERSRPQQTREPQQAEGFDEDIPF